MRLIACQAQQRRIQSLPVHRESMEIRNRQIPSLPFPRTNKQKIVSIADVWTSIPDINRWNIANS